MSDYKINFFFSHDWGLDNINHIKVCNIVKKLKIKGYTSWLDEENMRGNIDAAMADGIDNSQAIIICITKNYCNKINNTSRNMNKRDNCLKEWTYANARNKLLIPIIMEKTMLNINNWPPGIVSMYLGSVFYIDFTNDEIDDSINDFVKLLSSYKIYPNMLPDKMLPDKMLPDKMLPDKMLPDINKNLKNTTLYSKKRLPSIDKSIQEKLPIINNSSINNSSINNSSINSSNKLKYSNNDSENAYNLTQKEENLSLRIEEIVDKNLDIKDIKPPDMPKLHKSSIKSQFIKTKSKSKTTNISNAALDLRYKNTVLYTVPKRQRLNKTCNYISNVPLLRLCYPKQVTV